MSTPYTDEEIAFIREHYTAGVTKDIAAALGRTVEAVMYKAHTLGLHRDPQVLLEQQRALAKALCTTRDAKSVVAKSSATRKKLYESERRRELYGRPRKTNMHISFQTRAKREYRRRMRNNGYIELSPNDGYLYYSTATKRSRIMEKSAKRHGITILPYEEARTNI